MQRKFLFRKKIDRVSKAMCSFSLATILCISSFAGFSPNHVNAQVFSGIISRENMGIDLNQTIPGEKFTEPKSILITPIFMENPGDVDYETWYKGLYHYFSSDRFNFKDIPAHYIIDPAGNVYQGNSGGPEQLVLIEDGPDDPILIFYLTSEISNEFSSDAWPQIKSLVLKLANENSIEHTEIGLSKLVLDISKTENLVNLRSRKIFGNWQLDQSELQNYIQENYAPTQKQYALEIQDVSLPSGTIQSGSEIVAKMTIENSGEHTIFGSSDSNLILTKEGGDSLLFLNGEWISKTQILLLDEQDILRPGDTKTINAKFFVPIIPASNIVETFTIQNGFGQIFPGSQITINIDVDPGQIKLLEILNTETGTLNVRSNPQFNSEVISKASPGEYYVWTKEEGGWYQIQIQGSTGWVSSKYVRVL